MRHNLIYPFSHVNVLIKNHIEDNRDIKSLSILDDILRTNEHFDIELAYTNLDNGWLINVENASYNKERTIQYYERQITMALSYEFDTIETLQDLHKRMKMEDLYDIKSKIIELILSTEGNQND